MNHKFQQAHLVFSDLFLGFRRSDQNSSIFLRENRKNLSLTSDQFIDLISNTSVLSPELNKNTGQFLLNPEIASAIGIKYPNKEILFTDINSTREFAKVISNGKITISVDQKYTILDLIFSEDFSIEKFGDLSTTTGNNVIIASFNKYNGAYYISDKNSLNKGVLTFRTNNINYLAIFHSNEMFIVVENYSFSTVKNLFGPLYSGRVIRSKIYPVVYLKINNIKQALEVLVNKAEILHGPYRFPHRKLIEYTDDINYYRDLVISLSFLPKEITVSEILSPTSKSYLRTSLLKTKEIPNKVKTKKIYIPILRLDPSVCGDMKKNQNIDIEIYNALKEESDLLPSIQFELLDETKSSIIIPSLIKSIARENLNSIKNSKNYSKFIKKIHPYILEQIQDPNFIADIPEYNLFNKVCDSIRGKALQTLSHLTISLIGISMHNIIISIFNHQRKKEEKEKKEARISKYDRFSDIFVKNTSITKDKTALTHKRILDTQINRTVHYNEQLNYFFKNRSRPSLSVRQYSDLDDIPLNGLIGSKINLDIIEVEFHE